MLDERVQLQRYVDGRAVGDPRVAAADHARHDRGVDLVDAALVEQVAQQVGPALGEQLRGSRARPAARASGPGRPGGSRAPSRGRRRAARAPRPGRSAASRSRAAPGPRRGRAARRGTVAAAADHHDRLGVGPVAARRATSPRRRRCTSDSSRSRSKTTWSASLLIERLVPVSPVDAPSTVETMLARSQGPVGSGVDLAQRRVGTDQDSHAPPPGRRPRP